jgi:LDH2 family malate/lactate/ureidoglycolate dehydrogenase
MIKKVGVEQVRRVAEQALLNVDVPPHHAKLQVDLLLEAELRGRPSHGLLRLPRIIERIENGVASASATGLRRWTGHSLLEVDGQNGLGPVVAMGALEEAAAVIGRKGAAAVAISNNNHLGMLAWYAEALAARGYVTIGFSTSEALVHAWGGRTAMLGTNPVAIGVPTAGAPFVLDMATSLVSMGQIHDYAQRGERLPEGWALDAAGNPTTDAVAAKAGSIAPFGDAKGYALGLAIELLIVCLTDSAIGRDVTGTLDSTSVCNKGDLFILINPDPGEQMLSRLSTYLDAVRSSDLANDSRSVSVPGDRARASREKSLREGIGLPEVLWASLLRLANTPTRN